MPDLSMAMDSMERERFLPITVLGLDCDDPRALTHALEKYWPLFWEADIVAGATRFLGQLEQEKFSAIFLPLTVPVENFISQLERHLERQKKILVLADGDPLFFGIGNTLIKAFGPRIVKIITARSCLQAACARAALPWHEFAAISMHGRDSSRQITTTIRRHQPFCLLTGTGMGPDGIATMLMDRGVKDLDIHVFEHMGQTDETCHKMDMAQCADKFFADCCVMLGVPDVAGNSSKLNDDCFYGQYATKLPVRGLILEMMGIDGSDYVWDIGSGSGLLAVAFASRAHAGYVTAVEASYSRALDIQLNRAVAKAVNLDIVWGRAPQCLEALERPDKIFIGGGLSGEEGMRILEVCHDSLKEGGTMLISCILLETFDLWRQWLRQIGGESLVYQAQAARVSPLGHCSHLAPINPVFVCSWKKIINE